MSSGEKGKSDRRHLSYTAKSLLGPAQSLKHIKHMTFIKPCMKPKVEFQVGIDDLVKMCIISPYKKEIEGTPGKHCS